jgi:phosphatidylethanolamine/phosphatidyl-N-methylethanolamine N-methyltransferase
MPSTTWNRHVYRAWAPVYDALLERFFRPGRRAAATLLALQPGERVLLAGVGTGLDLPYLPPGVDAVGIDVSEPMLERARRTATSLPARIELRHADAAHTGDPAASFDAAILSLVLSVVPDPRQVLAETLRLLKPDGRLMVFDKFAPDNQPTSPVRRLLNVVTRSVGTDIDRRLADITSGQPCHTLDDQPSLLRGQYRVVLLARDRESGHRPR